MSKVTGGTGITDDLETPAHEIRQEPLLDAARRARMRRRVLAALAPKGPSLGDRAVSAIGLLAIPAPYVLRALAVAIIAVGVVAGATVAAAGALPDEPLYGVKLAAEHVRLALATTPVDRATVQLSLAEHRLAEAERLALAGLASATLIASSAYGEHLANAAAELATVETLEPKTATLVTQLASRLADQQSRSADTAAALVRDPRTERAGAILATVAQPTAAPAGLSAATRIAESAARVAEQLATVAEKRAREADVSSAAAPLTQRTEPPRRPPLPRLTDSLRRAAPARPTDARPAAGAIGSPPALSDGARQAAAPTSSGTAKPAATPTVNPSAAKKAVEKARQAAERARQAAEKAKQASKRTATPKPALRPGPTASPTPRP